MSVAPDWSGDELAVLKSNRHLTSREVAPLIVALGVKRTIAAINKQRSRLGLAYPRGQQWSESFRAQQRVRSGQRQEAETQWPKVPAPELADRAFLTAVLKSMRAIEAGKAAS